MLLPIVIATWTEITAPRIDGGRAAMPETIAEPAPKPTPPPPPPPNPGPTPPPPKK